MKINSLELCNWGRFPRVFIPMDTTKENNVVLIRARNNIGKTTLFYSLKYVLYGEKGLKTHKNQHFITDWITIREAAKSDGKTFVELIIEHDGKTIRIQRSQKFLQTNSGDTIQVDGPEEIQIFDQDSGEPITEAGKENTSKQNWINSILIPQDVSQFFFFDGEDIKRYTDEFEAEVRQAISRVLGIKALENSKKDLHILLETFIKNHQNKMKEASSDEQLKESLERKQGELETIKNAKHYETKNLEQARITKEKITEQLKQHTVSREKIKERTRIEDANIDLHKSFVESQKKLKEIHNLSSILLLEPLLKFIDKTEENPPSKDQWVSKTVKNMLDRHFKNCVCGAEIDKELQEEFEKLVLDLKPNPQAQLKRFVEEILGNNHLEKNATELNHIINEEIRIQSEIDTNKTTIKKINEELPGRNADSTVKKLQEKEELAVKEIVIIKNSISNADKEIAQTEKIIEKINKKLEQGIKSEDVEIAKHQKNYVQVLMDGMETCIDTYFQKRKPELEKFISDVFMQLISTPKLYKKIHMNDNWDVQIEYYDGTLLYPYEAGPSSGGSQILATAVIAGLNKFAAKDAPVVIDTPLGRLDDIHRTNLLKYYNKMSKQVIILYTPTEITDSDQIILEDYVKKHYEIITAEDSPAISKIIPYEGLA